MNRGSNWENLEVKEKGYEQIITKLIRYEQLCLNSKDKNPKNPFQKRIPRSNQTLKSHPFLPNQLKTD